MNLPVNNGKMSELDATHKFSQILSAVNYCHRNKDFDFL